MAGPFGRPGAAQGRLMARRASGGQTIRVPGVHGALRDYLVAFANQWDSRQAWSDVEALDAFQLVVTGDTLWRATFDSSRPEESDRFLEDTSHYLISAPDTVETVTGNN